MKIRYRPGKGFPKTAISSEITRPKTGLSGPVSNGFPNPDTSGTFAVKGRPKTGISRDVLASTMSLSRDLLKKIMLRGGFEVYHELD